jgi:hypothetical protein
MNDIYLAAGKTPINCSKGRSGALSSNSTFISARSTKSEAKGA